MLALTAPGFVLILNATASFRNEKYTVPSGPMFAVAPLALSSFFCHIQRICCGVGGAARV